MTNKPVRSLVNFIKSEEGGITRDNVIKIGGITLGLLGGLAGNELFAARSHNDSVDLIFDAGTPKVGTHVNAVSWSWSWHAWSSWSSY
jgi:hypothetical protein